MKSVWSKSTALSGQIELDKNMDTQKEVALDTIPIKVDNLQRHSVNREYKEFSGYHKRKIK